MDELTAGVAAAQSYIDANVLPNVPRWLHGAVTSVITEERLRELVADVLDAAAQIRAVPDAEPFPAPLKGNTIDV